MNWAQQNIRITDIRISDLMTKNPDSDHILGLILDMLSALFQKSYWLLTVFENVEEFFSHDNIFFSAREWLTKYSIPRAITRLDRNRIQINPITLFIPLTTIVRLIMWTNTTPSSLCSAENLDSGIFLTTTKNWLNIFTYKLRWFFVFKKYFWSVEF